MPGRWRRKAPGWWWPTYWTAPTRPGPSGRPAGRPVSVEVDVSREDDTLRMTETAMDAFGRVDVLVNNAAIYLSINRRPFYEISAEEWDRVTAVNIKGVFLCAKAVFPHMRDQGGGKIINISSNTVMAGTPDFLHYIASKSALVGMTRSMARELGTHGINVNAIAPGLVEHEGQTVPGEISASRVRARSIQRRQTPEDLTGALLYLASPDSDFVTGQDPRGGRWRPPPLTRHDTESRAAGR